MKIRKITQKNLATYKEMIAPDIMEHVGRKYYRALAFHNGPDNAPVATLIWELKNAENDSATKSEIKWLYAKDAEAGKALFSKYEKMAAEDDVTTSFFELPADCKDVRITILKEAGFRLEEKENRDIVVTVKDLAALPIAEQQSIPSQIVNVGSLTLHQLRKGLVDCVFHGKTGLFEDLTSLPFSWFEPELSCCVQMDGKVNGFLLVHKMSSGRLSVELLAASKPATQQDMIHMLRFSILRALKNYPEDTQIVIRRCNEVTKNFTDKLFPMKKGIPSIDGEK